MPHATQGMIKMYNAEVLSKFPVVQHFPFGSLFLWDPDPTAVVSRDSAHIASQPQKPNEMGPPSAARTFAGQAPWAVAPRGSEYLPGGRVSAPRTSTLADTAPLRTSPGTTRAPWSNLNTARSPPPPVRQPPKFPWTSVERESDNLDANLPTQAPWAKKDVR
jgi:serine/threonine-protein phosphatase 2A activator